jgi:hypothetical protein
MCYPLNLNSPCRVFAPCDRKRWRLCREQDHPDFAPASRWVTFRFVTRFSFAGQNDVVIFVPETHGLEGWGGISSGRCERIDFKICSELGVKKNRSRMPYKRPLRCRQAFGIKNKIAKTQANQFFYIFLARNSETPEALNVRIADIQPDATRIDFAPVPLVPVGERASSYPNQQNEGGILRRNLTRELPKAWTKKQVTDRTITYRFMAHR